MKKPTTLLSALALSVCLFAGISASQATLPDNVPGQPAIPSLAPMLAKVLPAVVSVQIEGVTQQRVQIPEALQPFFRNKSLDEDSQPFEGLGSGVIIDANKGYVLTNNHVIAGADKIKIQLNDGREFVGKRIGSDSQTDIALLQIQNASHLTAIQMADSDKLRVGDFAVAVGNPFGLGQTATSGIISALGRSGLNIEGLENFIQTDAAINRGNSGGALLNLDGQLIGINTAILSPSSGGSVGIGFAIPSNMAHILAEQLIATGQVKRGLLGIRGVELTADLAQAFHLNVQRGAFVNQVLPDSGSAKAGIKPGDVITRLNGQPLGSFSELRVKIATTLPGNTVQLGLIRDGKLMTVDVTLDNNNAATHAEQLSPLLEGAALSEGKSKQGNPGIKVGDVKKGSPAAQAGLHNGDMIIGINRERTRTLADARKILATQPAVIALEVMRGNENIYLLLQ